MIEKGPAGLMESRRLEASAPGPGNEFRLGLILECIFPAVVAAAFIIPPALYHPLASFDEAWYASVARNAVQTGDWWNLRYNGEHFWDKPPIAIWATAAAYRLFGLNEFTTRIFAILCGLSTVLAVFIWGRSQGGRRLGWLCVLLLLACHDWLRFCAKGQMDAPVTLFILLHILFFWHGLRRPGWHWAAGVCLGLAVSTKNQVGAFGMFAIAAYIPLARDFRPFRQPAFYASIAVAAAVAAPWFAQQWFTHGSTFLDEYWRMNVTHRQYAARAGEAADFGFYPRYLLTRQFAVCAGLACSLASIARSRLASRPRSAPFAGVFGEEGRWTLLLWLWLAAVVAACVKIGAVHYWYLIPMYPAAILLIGGWLSRSMLRRRPAWTLAAVGVLAAVQAATYYLPPPQETELWAARRLARAVQSATGPGEIVHLPLHPDDPRLQINIPAAHFYFDRISEEIPDYDNFVGLVALRGEITVVAHRTLLEERYGMVVDASPSLAPSSGETAPVAWRLLGEWGGFVALRVHPLRLQVADNLPGRTPLLR